MKTTVSNLIRRHSAPLPPVRNVGRSVQAIGLGLIVAVLSLIPSAIRAQPIAYKDLHDFGATVVNANNTNGPDGVNPIAGVTFDSSGNMYGTTDRVGPHGGGMVWEITSGGTYIDLHDFGGTVTNADGQSGPDGSFPYAGVTVDASGDLFGCTQFGGPIEDAYATGTTGGMVWEITHNGVYIDLHDFGGTITNAGGSTGPDGTHPWSKIVIDGSGNLFGTTTAGGPNKGSMNIADHCGIVWEITALGSYRDLHDFGGTVTNADGIGGPDGIEPEAGVAIDGAGNLYGTTTYGGPNKDPNFGYLTGMVWELTHALNYYDLHDFGGTVTYSDATTGEDGTFPTSAVTLDGNGNLFGATVDGGESNEGMIWEITSSSTYRDLHDFGGTVLNWAGTSVQDGVNPYGGVSVDSAGNLFGTGQLGGANGDGMVFELTSGGSFVSLHDFGGTVTNAGGTSGPDGEAPDPGVTIDANGNLYGTAYDGGPNGGTYGGYGIVWSLSQITVTNVGLRPSTIGGLGTATGFVSISSAAPPGGWKVSLHAGASGYVTMPTSITIPAGAFSASFTVTGTGQRTSTIHLGIFASDLVSQAEAILTIQGDNITSLALNPSQIKWTSGTSTATVSIGTAAPSGGWIVNLHAGASGYVNMPSSVTIPEGKTSAAFSVSGNGLRFFTLNLGIYANDGNTGAEAILTIAGDAIKSLALNPSTIGWSGSSTATVNLVVPAPPGGWVVNVNAGAPGYVNLPSTVTVPAGATSANFTVSGAGQRTVTLTMGIYVNDGQSNVHQTLALVGDALTNLALNPTSIGWSGTSTATVTLSSPAPLGGWVITLHAGAPGYLSMPTSVTVPAGSSTTTFAITGVAQHSNNLSMGVFASDGNASVQATLILTGDSIQSLVLTPSSVAPGEGSTGTVTLTSPAPIGGWVVKLTVGAPAYVGVPTTVMVPAGSTSVTFPITTKATDPATGVGVVANDGGSQDVATLTIT